jgi:NADH-quinone oxidoreductase subunit N
VFFVKTPAELFFGGFSIDSFMLLGKMLLIAITAFVLLSSYDYFTKKDSVYGELPYLYLIALLGLMFMLSSNNLAIIFVGLELASISMYILVGLFRKDYLSKEGAFKYLVVGTSGTSMFVLGSALVYLSGGSISVGVSMDSGNTLFLLGSLLIIFALALKVSSVPFHFWTPDAYEGAPTPTTSFLATVPKVAMYFLFVKLSVGLFHNFEERLIILSILAVASMFYGNLMAYTQRSVKRLLAYSSIAHAGYFLLALTYVDKLLASSLIFYVFVYAMATLGAFTVLSVLEKKEGWTHHFLDFQGLREEHPILATAMAIFLFALIGLPPMAVFVGKLGIFMGLMKHSAWVLGVLFVLASIISAGYYLKVIVYMFLYKQERKFGGVNLSGGEFATLVSSAVGVILLGIFPHLILSLILGSIAGG